MWSRPICVYCKDFGGKSVDANTLQLGLPRCQRYEKTGQDYKMASHGIIVEGITTVQESFMNMSERAMVWGYVDKSEDAAWEWYATAIFVQNKNLAKIEFHMYCSHAQYPYFVRATRESPDAIEPTVEWMMLERGVFFCFELVEEGRLDEKGRPFKHLDFNVAKYIDTVLNNRKALKLTEKLILRPSGCWV